MICSSSCVLVSIWPPHGRGGRCPQEPRAQLEKSNPRARSNTERPVKRLPASGLETTSAIKQSSASAGSSRPDFPARNGHPARDIQGLGGTFPTSPDVAQCRLTSALAAAKIAGRRLTSPYAGGRWLPVWLPGLPLATLTSE